MDGTDDFTFCQPSVGLKMDNDHLESPESAPSISSITLEENHIRGLNIHEIGNSIRDDRSRNIGTLKDSREANESLEQKSVGESGIVLNQPKERNSATKKPVVRAKVPFEKGYSQMEWLKLTRTEPDLAGLKGQSNRRLISMDEVKLHKTENCTWTVLKGRVYNISPYLKFHPGGVDMLMKAAGKDCTALFNKYHAWVNAEFLLEKCLVGVIEDSS